MVGRLSTYLINSLSSVTVMTAQFIFMLFIFLYTMFFFLVDGRRILSGILHYLPLKLEDQERMLDKFTSVTRATLKGIAVIGIVQGALGRSGLRGGRVSRALFSGERWPPSCPWCQGSHGDRLAARGDYPVHGRALRHGQRAAGVLHSGGGGIDNFVRPRLVGKDTRLHELLILLEPWEGSLCSGWPDHHRADHRGAGGDRVGDLRRGVSGCAVRKA